MSRKNGNNGSNGDGNKLNRSVPTIGNNGHRKVRVDWEHNHHLIEKAFMEIYDKEGRPPMYKEIAKHSGLSFMTVKRHIKEVDLSKYLSTKIRAMVPTMLMGQLKKAIKNEDTEAARFIANRFPEIMDKAANQINLNIDFRIMTERLDNAKTDFDRSKALRSILTSDVSFKEPISKN